ncbi:YhgE/Pip family protein [Nocardia sp. NPDC005825]|uniref:YhgE/Pip family protein n=1 Tax=unclassified Nocardia TaxID=2637762 RepID=UPI0033CB342C
MTSARIPRTIRRSALLFHAPAPQTRRAPISRWHRTRAARLFLAVAVTAPLVTLALYMWAGWDPTRSLDRLPVALVNLDQPAQQGSTTLTVGNDVTNSLLASHALDFHTVDHDAALAGLASGRYYFVVEIPADFSRTLAGLGTTSMAPALISVVYNDRTTVMASNIGARAMSVIDAAVLEGVATKTVATLLTGLDGLGGGIRSAAQGSDQLHNGLTELATGTDTLVTGIREQLAPGASAAATGGAQLAAGTAALATGLNGLQTGTGQLGDGAKQVASGIDRLVATVNVDKLQQALGDLAGQLPPGALDQITQLLDGLRQLQAGSHQVADQLTDPHAAYRSGVDQLVAGGVQVDAGAAKLAAGLRDLDTGIGQLAAGAVLLQQGAHAADDGSGQLADGLASGTRQVPDLSDANHRDSLAHLLSTPVNSQQRNLAPAQFGGPGAAPLLLILVTALVPIVVLMCLRAHRFVAADEPLPALGVAVRRTIAAGAYSLIVTGLLAVAIWHVLSPAPTVASLPHVIAAVSVATIMNTALVSLLFTGLGYVAGSLGSLAALMLQIFAYGGVWMVQTLPAPLRWLHPIAPMTYTQRALVASFDTAPGFAGALLVIVAITAVAVAVNVLIYRSGRAQWPHAVLTEPDTLAAAA